MAEIKGTETEKNLLKAFAGESAARNRYYIFAQQAKQEGYDYIAKAFEEAADNEREHAKIWFKWMNNNEFPKTLQNLETSANSEKYEWTDMYAKFAQKAKEEGLESLSDLFSYVAGVEKTHENKFRKLMLTIKNENIEPDANGNYKWVCSACESSLEQKDKPNYCPICAGEDIFFYKI